MNNKVGFNRLGRKPSHRRAMLRNLVASLLEHEQITTTKAKAREACRQAEKMITRAKNDTVHSRRLVARDLTNKDLLKKLFTDLAVRCAKRNGGYTRIVKLGFRQGDAAEMVILELVDKVNTTTEAKVAPKKKVAPKAKEKEEISQEVTADDSSAPVVEEKKATVKKATTKVAKKDAGVASTTTARRTTNRGK